MILRSSVSYISKMVVGGGRQVLPAEWVSETYVPRIDAGFRMKMEYGLHWWLPGYLQEGTELPSRMAQGNGGQTLLLFPSHNLLVVTMAGYYNDVCQDADPAAQTDT